MKTSKLQQLQDLSEKPFYSTPVYDRDGNKLWTEQDSKDYDSYKALKAELTEAASKLKKGQKVLATISTKIKDKKESLGFRLKSEIIELEVYQPLKTTTRTKFGEESSHTTIKVADSKYVHSLQPYEVEAIEVNEVKANNNLKIQVLSRPGKGISSYYAIVTVGKVKYDLELTALLDKTENQLYVNGACGRNLPSSVVKTKADHKAYMEALLLELTGKYTEEQIMSVVERQLTKKEQEAQGFVFKSNAVARPAGTPFVMPKVEEEALDLKPVSKSDQIVALLKAGKTSTEITAELKAQGLKCYSSEIYNAKKKIK